MQSSNDAGAIVLAGGRSRRFAGGEKALATIDGQPLLSRVVSVARKAVDSKPILAVATTDQRETYADVLDVPVQFVTDRPGRDGPLAGLEGAVEASTATWVFVLGCDMPAVSEAAIEWLGERRTDSTDAVVPRTNDGRQPLHAWYRREAVVKALAVDRSERSLHALLDRLSVTAASAEDAPVSVPLERSVYNVNTRSALGDARELIED